MTWIAIVEKCDRSADISPLSDVWICEARNRRICRAAVHPPDRRHDGPGGCQETVLAPVLVWGSARGDSWPEAAHRGHAGNASSRLAPSSRGGGCWHWNASPRRHQGGVGQSCHREGLPSARRGGSPGAATGAGWSPLGGWCAGLWLCPAALGVVLAVVAAVAVVTIFPTGAVRVFRAHPRAHVAPLDLAAVARRSPLHRPAR